MSSCQSVCQVIRVLLLSVRRFLCLSSSAATIRIKLEGYLKQMTSRQKGRGEVINNNADYNRPRDSRGLAIFIPHVDVGTN